MVNEMDIAKSKAQLKTELSRFSGRWTLSANISTRGILQRRRNIRISTSIKALALHGISWVYSVGIGTASNVIGKEKNFAASAPRSRDVREWLYLVPIDAAKKLGARVTTNSKRIFANKKKVQLVRDDIVFHGAILTVDVHNAYKSTLFGKGREINVAATRMVTLRERDQM